MTASLQPALLVQPYRFTFRCEQDAHFPEGMLTNHLRGAFGLIFQRMSCSRQCPGSDRCPTSATCPYARLFAPKAQGPDSADLPRPFLLRAPSSGPIDCARGQTFTVDLHLFDLSQPYLRYFIWAFAELAHQGLGAGRRRVRLESVARILEDGVTDCQVYDGRSIRPDAESVTLRIPLQPAPYSVDSLLLAFHTPTMLKHRGELLGEPYFPAIAVRARTRITGLRCLYQSAAPDDPGFPDYALRAQSISLAQAQIRQLCATRRSLRTGQHQKLAGFIGLAVFEGHLAEFLPYFRAAYWCGIGRETVWGHGAVQPFSLPMERSRFLQLARKLGAPVDLDEEPIFDVGSAA